MTVARSRLVDTSVTRYYHCISRCVRRAFLCGDGYEHRKQWIEDRLELLASCFSVSVCGFAVMDNHLHVLVRLDPQGADGWSDEEVVRRWIKVYPPKTLKGDEIEINQAWIDHQLKDGKKVAAMRERLASLGWFMKALKEPLARMANAEDECRGTFWESRYKSVAILDDEALLATCAYIDLNPVAAGSCGSSGDEQAYVGASARSACSCERKTRGVAEGSSRHGCGEQSCRRSGARSLGFVRWRTVVDLARAAKGCWSRFRWATTCCWSTIRVAYAATGKRESAETSQPY